MSDIMINEMFRFYCDLNKIDYTEENFKLWLIEMGLVKEE